MSNPKILSPYTDLFMVVGNKCEQSKKSQTFRLHVQNLRTSKIIAVTPTMLKKVSVSDLSKSDFDIFKLLNIDYKRINTQTGGHQNSLQLVDLEESLAGQDVVTQPNVGEKLVQQPQNVEEQFEENTDDKSDPGVEGVSQGTDNLEEVYSRSLNIKRVRRLPNRFNDYEMNYHMLLTPNVDLNKLSKYQKDVAALDETHRQSFYRGLTLHINMCRNNCRDDAIYEILLKHLCKEQYGMYTLDNVPKLKYTGNRVVFNKTVQCDDKSQGDLSIASLFIVSDHCNVDTLLRYDITQKEANFARKCIN